MLRRSRLGTYSQRRPPVIGPTIAAKVLEREKKARASLSSARGKTSPTCAWPTMRNVQPPMAWKTRAITRKVMVGERAQRMLAVRKQACAASIGPRRPFESASGPETSGWIAWPIVSARQHERIKTMPAHSAGRRLTGGDGEGDHGGGGVEVVLHLLEAGDVDGVRRGHQDRVERHHPQHLRQRALQLAKMLDVTSGRWDIAPRPC